MITGLTILCSSRPNFIQMRLSGLSSAGRSRAATTKMEASVAVHGHIRPACQTFSADTTAKAPAMTSPNVRSEPTTISSSREKLSWVDWSGPAIRLRYLEGSFIPAPFRGCGRAAKAEKASVPGTCRHGIEVEPQPLQFRHDGSISYAL